MVVLQLQNSNRIWRTSEEKDVPLETAEAHSSVCMKFSVQIHLLAVIKVSP